MADGFGDDTHYNKRIMRRIIRYIRNWWNEEPANDRLIKKMDKLKLEKDEK
jgi:hypothetical protein